MMAPPVKARICWKSAVEMCAGSLGSVTQGKRRSAMWRPALNGQKAMPSRTIESSG
jgi:hypothetical protein